MLRMLLKPSRTLAIVLCAAHAGAAAVLPAVDLPAEVQALLAFAIGASLAHGVRHHALRLTRSAGVALELRDDGLVAVQARSGGWHEARVLGSTFVSPALVIINLRISGRRTRHHLVLLPDAAEADDLRRLRVLLRWKYRAYSDVPMR